MKKNIIVAKETFKNDPTNILISVVNFHSLLYSSFIHLKFT